MPPNNGPTRRNAILEVLYGGEVPEKVPGAMTLVAECIEIPSILYRHVEAIVSDPAVKGMRLHLVRVQLHSELNMREDVDLYTQRIWVAQTLERIVFGGLLVEGEKVKDKDRSESDDG